MKNLVVIVVIMIFVTTACNSNKTTTNVDISGLNIDIEHLNSRKTVNDQDRSIAEYVESNLNRPDSIHNVIYILPFGNMKPEVEEIITNEIAYLEIFFALEVRMLEKVSYNDIKEMENVNTRFVPDSDYEYYMEMKGEPQNLREQIEASSFIDNYIINNMPEDAIVVLGITEHDIYNPDYNFLFGCSRLTQGVGLVSTFRLIDYGSETKYNIRKVVSKQIANMFSIKNVKDYECLLNYHNSMAELQNGEFKISPNALMKLKFNIGFDYYERFKQLKEFWAMEGNEIMEDYYSDCLISMENDNIE